MPKVSSVLFFHLYLRRGFICTEGEQEAPFPPQDAVFDAVVYHPHPLLEPSSLQVDWNFGCWQLTAVFFFRNCPWLKEAASLKVMHSSWDAAHIQCLGHTECKDSSPLPLILKTSLKGHSTFKSGFMETTEAVLITEHLPFSRVLD